ncbi:formin-like protein 5 [Canis lupus familiaris]|uniref:formin-like protein 5 n=1 Tax=Canis lupus familiaris TaxID=9615 RepID=UPI0018F51030|nr:formin-like protein 5 [Canis lupus familiaris]XP_038542327.1 formin-like protein 5 [Canis lupus familiaris]
MPALGRELPRTVKGWTVRSSESQPPARQERKGFIWAFTRQSRTTQRSRKYHPLGGHTKRFQLEKGEEGEGESRVLRQLPAGRRAGAAATSASQALSRPSPATASHRGPQQPPGLLPSLCRPPASSVSPRPPWPLTGRLGEDREWVRGKNGRSLPRDVGQQAPPLRRQGRARRPPPPRPAWNQSPRSLADRPPPPGERRHRRRHLRLHLQK